MTLPHGSTDAPWTPTVPRDAPASWPHTPATSAKHPCTLRPTARPWWRILLQGLI